MIQTSDIKVARHNWSGWPGAWCLDCGISDPLEQAMADGAIYFDEDNDGNLFHAWEEGKEAQYQCLPCPEPGSNRHNPYTKRS